MFVHQGEGEGRGSLARPDPDSSSSSSPAEPTELPSSPLASPSPASSPYRSSPSSAYPKPSAGRHETRWSVGSPRDWRSLHGRPASATHCTQAQTCRTHKAAVACFLVLATQPAHHHRRQSPRADACEPVSRTARRSPPRRLHRPPLQPAQGAEMGRTLGWVTALRGREGARAVHGLRHAACRFKLGDSRLNRPRSSPTASRSPPPGFLPKHNSCR